MKLNEVEKILTATAMVLDRSSSFLAPSRKAPSAGKLYVNNYLAVENPNGTCQINRCLPN